VEPQAWPSCVKLRLPWVPVARSRRGRDRLSELHRARAVPLEAPRFRGRRQSGDAWDSRVAAEHASTPLRRRMMLSARGRARATRAPAWHRRRLRAYRARAARRTTTPRPMAVATADVRRCQCVRRPACRRRGDRRRSRGQPHARLRRATARRSRRARHGRAARHCSSS
jgi:hypothetical protein